MKIVNGILKVIYKCCSDSGESYYNTTNTHHVLIKVREEE